MKKTLFIFAIISSFALFVNFVCADAFKTDNKSGYNAKVNEIRSGAWSYLYYGGTAELNSDKLCLLEKNGQNGGWCYSAASPDNYFLLPNGKICTSKGRQIIYNFTIGKELAGKDITVKGTFAGAASSELYVQKSSDQDVSHIADTELKGKFGTGSNGFEIEIPSYEAAEGDDLLFAVSASEIGHIYNTLSITIEEKESAVINGLTLCNSDETPPDRISENGFVISAQVSGDTEGADDLCMLAAVYDETGRMKRIKCDNVSVVNGEIKLEFTAAEAEGISGKDYLKAYVWNSLSEAKPLAGAVRFPQKSGVKQDISDITACNGAQTDMSEVGDIRWSRTDFAWQSVQPTENGGFSEEQLKKWGDTILECRKNGITMLPILDYTADWAADSSAYEYTYGTTRYIYGEAEEIDGKPSYWKRNLTVIKADGTASESTVTLRKSRQRFKDIRLWEEYVEKIVSTYSAEPYNLRYFQIWNEAHPSSSFWYGGMDYYMNVLHKSAADIIHKYGCKAVYGGWPECGDIGEYCALLDEYDMWDSIDVFDVHYFGISDMNTLYNRALKAGKTQPCIWQTEVGWISSKGWICGTYANMLSWALKHRSDKENQFKLFYFSWGAPNDPEAYGYGKVMRYNDGTLTYHGKSMKMLLDTLKADNTEIYEAFSFDAAKPERVYGFETDNKRAVIISDAADKKNIADKKVVCRGISGAKSVVLSDYSGEIRYDIEFDEKNGDLSFTVPADKLVTYTYSNAEKLYCYIIIDADEITAPTSNIINYELGSDIYGKSEILPGRWSYINCTSLKPLEKGTGANTFSAEEWTADNSEKLHKNCLDALGNIYVGTSPIAYNYTVGKDIDGKNAVIKGNFKPNGAIRTVRIYKTNDSDGNSIGGFRELLYEYTGRAAKDFSFNVSGSLYYGNDFVFEVSSALETDYSKYCSLNAEIEFK